MTGKTQVESHFEAPRSKLEDPFTSLCPVAVWPEEPYEIEFFKKRPRGTYSVNIRKKVFMVLGLNGLAIRAPDAKLPPNYTESRFGPFGISPGPQD